ncbi:MAG: cupredoxin family copper-binding protein [Chloroflexi bacterium]|nr:cupredoxin family copper-binding protein [Chloroflexota bacterium]
MARATIRPLIALSLVLGLLPLFAACSGGSSPAPTLSSPPPASENSVVMSNFAFVPATITIKAGDTVTWTNNDGTVHTVTSDTPGLFNSGSLAQNATYRRTFASAGTFTYHCTPHPFMQGSVVVE